MASTTDLPLRAFICTGCGWLHRGVDGRTPGGHLRQDAEPQRYFGSCSGHWKPVIVASEDTIDALQALYRTLLPIDPTLKELRT